MFSIVLEEGNDLKKGRFHVFYRPRIFFSRPYCLSFECSKPQIHETVSEDHMCEPTESRVEESLYCKSCREPGYARASAGCTFELQDAKHSILKLLSPKRRSEG